MQIVCSMLVSAAGNNAGESEMEIKVGLLCSTKSPYVCTTTTVVALHDSFVQ